jgi:hypothetical protein
MVLAASSCTTTTTPTSRPGHLVCLACESGELLPQQAHDGLAASCAVCKRLFSGVVLKVLAQIASLPEAQGQHACEACLHPQICGCCLTGCFTAQPAALRGCLLMNAELKERGANLMKQRSCRTLPKEEPR